MQAQVRRHAAAKGDPGHRNKVPPRQSPAAAETMAAGTSRAFASCYMDLCKRQHLRPLPAISVALPHCLDFATDRVKMDDWGPILHSLSLDQTLRSIGVRSRYQSRKPLEEVNSEEKARAIGKAPVLLTRFLLEWLSHSVTQCLRNSPVLTHLELDGIPLPPDCLAVLCVGLASTNTLRHLSLQRCRIGDGSCELLCRTVADVKSVRLLNLSQCDLTARSGPALAAALSRQKLMLYHDTWKDSLRYREPDLDAMPGLRRLTLNGNPQLGDSAAGEMAEAIRDSLWLKALDLRSCGLTDRAAYEFLSLLNGNPTLVVVDLRLNAIDEDILREITEKLGGTDGDNALSEYRWMPLPRKGKPASEAVVQHRLNVGRGFAVKTALPRSRSTMSRSQPKRQQQQQGASIGSSANGRGMKAKRTSPPVDDIEPPKTEGNLPRVSLRLDLRPEVCLVPSNDEPQEIGSVVDGAALKSPENFSSAATTLKVEEILQQLTEARAWHDRLLEETKRTDLLLAEEKMRREAAEAKLNATKEHLADLEAALKAKEEETRGYLLISRQSLDDICGAFDRLLEMLDAVARNPGVWPGNFDEGLNARETVKRHLARLIRKTKSESLPRVARPASPEPPETLRTEPIIGRKSTKSEADIRATLTPCGPKPMHLERSIGDSPDVTSPSRETNRFQDAKFRESPEQRARAIFAQIVREGSILKIGSHVG